MSAKSRSTDGPPFEVDAWMSPRCVRCGSRLAESPRCRQSVRGAESAGSGEHLGMKPRRTTSSQALFLRRAREDSADVETAPPKRGRPPATGDLIGSDKLPRRLLYYPEFLDAIHHEYLRRNSAEFQWASGDEDPLEADELNGSGESEGEQ